MKHMSIRIFKTNMCAEWRDGGSLSSSSRRRFISYSAVWPQILPIASDFCRPKPRVTRHPALQVRGAVPRTRRRNVAFSLFTYSIPVTCINTEDCKGVLTHSLTHQSLCLEHIRHHAFFSSICCCRSSVQFSDC